VAWLVQLLLKVQRFVCILSIFLSALPILLYKFILLDWSLLFVHSYLLVFQILLRLTRKSNLTINESSSDLVHFFIGQQPLSCFMGFICHETKSSVRFCLLVLLNDIVYCLSMLNEKLFKLIHSNVEGKASNE
jgi:hypothetical protein